MNDEQPTFKTVSISDKIIERIDNIYLLAGFSTRGGYINARLRSMVEKDELRYGGADEKDGKQHSGGNK